MSITNESGQVLQRQRGGLTAVQPITYSKESLLNICESHPHPAVRRSAATLLYAMGQRDQAAKLCS
jgi:hypothetical protein